MLDTRKLGRTGLEVTSLCLGTMTWGQQNTEAEGHAQLDLATERGINFIDTAEMYSIPPRAETQGSTERIIGTWLKARGGRDRLVIASKVSGRSSSAWLQARRQGRTARRGQHPLCSRAIAQASADRLHRSLSAALARSAGQPLRGRRQRLPRHPEGTTTRCRSRKRSACWDVSSKPARSVTSGFRTRRPGACRASCTHRTSGVVLAHGLDPERLQPREPHL